MIQLDDVIDIEALSPFKARKLTCLKFRRFRQSSRKVDSQVIQVLKQFGAF